MRVICFAAAVLAMITGIITSTSAAPVLAAGVTGVADTSGCIRQSSSVAVAHRATLVVTFGDRHTKTFCIEFVEDSITGVQLLQRSGLPLVTSGTSGLGAAVCGIDGEGSSDPTHCFASCTSGTCAYWAYYRFVSGAWQFSQAGGAQTPVHDGDIQGWAWGPGGVSAGAVPAPPGIICPPPTATPSPTSTPVLAPPTPLPTHAGEPAPPTPLPTSTAAPPPLPGAPNAPAIPDAPGGQATVPPAGEVPSPGGRATSPQSVVEGAARAPATSTPVRTPSTDASTATPASGAILVEPDQGVRNQTQSESRVATGGGTRTSLIAFAIVAAALAVVAGIVVYRRRHAI